MTAMYGSREESWFIDTLMVKVSKPGTRDQQGKALGYLGLSHIKVEGENKLQKVVL